MSSAKPGKADEIHDPPTKTSEDLSSKRQKSIVDTSTSDTRSQTWTQYNDASYTQTDTSRQIVNSDGTYPRDKVKLR